MKNKLKIYQEFHNLRLKIEIFIKFLIFFVQEISELQIISNECITQSIICATFNAIIYYI